MESARHLPPAAIVLTAFRCGVRLTRHHWCVTTPAKPLPEPRSRYWRPAGLVLVTGGLLVTVITGSPQWLVLAGFSTAGAFGIPMVLADSPGLARRLLPVALVLVAVLAAMAAVARATSDLPQRDREHDGGVIVTRAAAVELLHGRNPYTADFAPVLPASWRKVQGADGELVDNPVGSHFPYLPAAALVNVPFVAVAEVFERAWDPRVLGWVSVVGASVALARRPEPAWARLGAVLGVGSAFAVIYLSWGTNDAFAVALAVTALAVADRSPGWAGVALAVAVSAKLLLAVLLPPLALVVWMSGGWAALRRWWTFPAVMTATILPALVVDHRSFLDDAVWFNLGRVEPRMPTSGLGLPAVAPGLDGPALALITALGLVVALVVPLMAVRRWPSVWTAGASAGLALLAVLIPARTFQVNYLVLVAALLPLVLMEVASRTGGEMSTRH